MTQMLLDAAALLKPSPKAPPLLFRVDAKQGMQFDNAKEALHQLRYQPEGSKTLFPVRRNAEGQFYYDSDWKPFAELLEASARQLPKKIAAMEPESKAPEIGFSFPFAFMAILGQHPLWQSPPLMQDESGVLSYLQDVLERHGPTLLQQMQHDCGMGTMSLLDAALMSRRFAVAEMLWAVGVRPHRESLEKAHPLWAMVASATPPYSPAWETSFEHRAAPYLGHLFKQFHRNIDDLDDYFLVLSQVWLNRFQELKINPMATRGYADAAQSKSTQFTAFEAALRSTVGSLWQSPREDAWLETMKVLGYDFNKLVHDPFLSVETVRPEALSDWARKLNHPEDFVGKLREMALESNLEGGSTPTPKPRF